VMDGQFVTNITLGPVVIAGIRKLTQLFLDTHLMIVEPSRYVAEFRAAGCDGITVHVEACADVGATLAAVRETGARVGLSLNPDTPLEPWIDYLDDIDLLLLMTVFPGRGGQSFMPEVLPKIERAAELRTQEGFRYAIEVDGGISPKTAGLVREKGADVLVAGSAIFKNAPYATPIAAMRAMAAIPPAPR
jgi:ribulose-phosphate 3-epimerase